MTAEDIDRYLAEVPEPARTTLEQLRRDVLAVVPHAEQCISYGVPAFKVNGTTVAGFAAFRHHLSYLPHSGSVLPALGDDLAGYRGSTKSALHFAPDEPLPADWCASCSKPGCANTTHGRPDHARSWAP